MTGVSDSTKAVEASRVDGEVGSPDSLGEQSTRIVVTVTGRQSPDALSRVMHVLGARGSMKLLDFGQLVVRDKFIATAVLASPSRFDSDASLVGESERDGQANEGDAEDAFKGIIVRAYALGYQVDFDASQSLRRKSLPGLAPVPDATTDVQSSETESTKTLLRKDDYILTLFAPGRLRASVIADATRIVAEYSGNIRSINRLSDEGDAYMCLELGVSVVRDESTVAAMRRDLFALGREGSADVAMQPARVIGMAKRIVVFDLSWTLVQCDAVDVLLSAAGVAPSAAELAERQEGLVSDVTWLRQRVSRLKGHDAETVNEEAFRDLSYTDGAKQLCRGLKKLGCRLAVVSSGSRKIAEKAKDDLGLHFAYGNNFDVDASGNFTGAVSEPVVDAGRKADLVQMLGMQEGVDVEQIVAVGDGPVSSKMLEAAGMSVAFDQPDSVDAMQTGRISSKSLASVFFLLGVTGRDFNELLRSQ